MLNFYVSYEKKQPKLNIFFNVFSQSQSAEYFIRFNVAQVIDRRIFEVLAQALAVSRLDDDVE